MTNYRAMGTTDHVTECQICGKPELKGTVILQILDADGNAVEVTYAGSTCGARLVGSKATKIRQEASNADYRRNQAVKNSLEVVAYYEPHESNPPALASTYAKANAGYFRNFPDSDALAMARDCLARHREIIETNGLSAIQ